jgi:hypothetical protein
MFFKIIPYCFRFAPAVDHSPPGEGEEEPSLVLLLVPYGWNLLQCKRQRIVHGSP